MLLDTYSFIKILKGLAPVSLPKRPNLWTLNIIQGDLALHITSTHPLVYFRSFLGYVQCLIQLCIMYYILINIMHCLGHTIKMVVLVQNRHNSSVLLYGWEWRYEINRCRDMTICVSMFVSVCEVKVQLIHNTTWILKLSQMLFFWVELYKIAMFVGQNG